MFARRCIATLRYCVAWLLLASLLSPAGAAQKAHSYTFDQPMTWSDDIVLKGLKAIQSWDVVGGGRQGNALRISAAVWKQPYSHEIRTLQFSHQPRTRADISFDMKAINLPARSSLKVRYFDGYCGGEPFGKIADDELAPFPAPIWDSSKVKLAGNWQHFEMETGVLENTVLTMAFIVEQEATTSAFGEPQYMEVMLDNLKVEVTLLDTLMDLGFDWHGVPGSSTREFRQNVACYKSDWCDFADQEDVETPEGVIHYTLLQQRDSSSQPKPAWKHQLVHASYSDYAGGVSAIVLDRWGGGKNSSASWGIRQTVSYAALGLKAGEAARVKVMGKITNFNPDDREATSVQIGVDPFGDVITQKAIWSPQDKVNFKSDGWSKPMLEFERPKDAQGFTIFFRHRDGLPITPVELLPFDEPQTAGSGVSGGIADWMMVSVVK